MYNFSKSMLKSAYMYVECFILDKRFKKISNSLRNVVKYKETLQKYFKNTKKIFFFLN